MSEPGQLDDGTRGDGEDLSIPMWVWTLLGFALLTAVAIVVIIWGGASRAERDAETELSPMTETVVEDPATGPATQPAATQGL